MAERLQKRIAELYFYKIWNQRDFRLTPYLFSDQCITRHICSSGGAEQVSNAEEINNYIRQWIKGFPNLQVRINRIVGDPLHISTYCTFVGTHHGPWQGIEPTGKPVAIDIIMIHKLCNGKIVENLIMIDYLGIYKQLGVLHQLHLLPEPVLT